MVVDVLFLDPAQFNLFGVQFDYVLCRGVKGPPIAPADDLPPVVVGLADQQQDLPVSHVHLFAVLADVLEVERHRHEHLLRLLMGRRRHSLAVAVVAAVGVVDVVVAVLSHFMLLII